MSKREVLKLLKFWKWNMMVQNWEIFHGSQLVKHNWNKWDIYWLTFFVKSFIKSHNDPRYASILCNTNFSQLVLFPLLQQMVYILIMQVFLEPYAKKPLKHTATGLVKRFCASV